MSSIDEIKSSLEGLKTKVSGLKTRATNLATVRENLIREAATLEQTRNTALTDLKELGIVPKNLEPATLEALAGASLTELDEAIKALESTLSQAEALVGGKTTTTPGLDL